MSESETIVFCGCYISKVFPDAVREEVLSGLRKAGVDFTLADDLCRLSARRDEILKQWAGAEKLKIIACFPRAIINLFQAAGAPLPEGVEIYNMRSREAKGILASAISEVSGQGQEEKIARKDDEWIPWFPTIDYERCVNCKQCMNFCLFGVYTLDGDEHVQVENPDHCKTNCPACARMCPSKAIVFPKYTDGHICGDEVRDDEEDGAQSLELTKGDVLERIRQRSFKGGDVTDITKELGIGPEVLASLSAEEISKIKKRAETKNDG
jgi:NAD-dependent dihydropyrimidine dehydrogenase PreA subunit